MFGYSITQVSTVFTWYFIIFIGFIACLAAALCLLNFFKGIIIDTNYFVKTLYWLFAAASFLFLFLALLLNKDIFEAVFFSVFNSVNSVWLNTFVLITFATLAIITGLMSAAGMVKPWPKMRRNSVMYEKLKLTKARMMFLLSVLMGVFSVACFLFVFIYFL